MVFWITTTYRLVRLPTVYPEIGDNILMSAHQTTWCPNSNDENDFMLIRRPTR